MDSDDELIQRSYKTINKDLEDCIKILNDRNVLKRYLEKSNRFTMYKK